MLEHPDGQVFPFDAGTLCLELCVSGGEGYRARFEALHAPADYPRWAARGRLDLPGHGVDPASVAATDADLVRVKQLREAIWSAANAAARGDRPARADVVTINDIAAGRGVVPQVDPGSGRPGWRRPVTAGQLTVAYARDAVLTFAEPAVQRVRQCSADNCLIVYLDTSRPGRRRWCAMQRCGNRHKVAEHRARSRGPSGAEGQ